MKIGASTMESNPLARPSRGRLSPEDQKKEARGRTQSLSMVSSSAAICALMVTLRPASGLKVSSPPT